MSDQRASASDSTPRCPRGVRSYLIQARYGTGHTYEGQVHAFALLERNARTGKWDYFNCDHTGKPTSAERTAGTWADCWDTAFTQASFCKPPSILIRPTDKPVASLPPTP